MTRQAVIILIAEHSSELGVAHLLAAFYHQQQDSLLVLPVMHKRSRALMKHNLTFMGIEYTEMSVASFFESEMISSVLKKQVECLDESNQTDNLLHAYEIAFNRQLTTELSCSGKPVCIGVGEAGLQSALQYALLTDRVVYYVPDYNYLSSDWFARVASARSLFLFPSETFSIENLHQLMEAKEKSAPSCPIGFAYPFGQLHREVMRLKMVVTMSCEASANRSIHTFLPLSSQKRTIEVGKYKISSGYEESRGEEWLHQEAQALIVMSHSNGVNMSLGRTVLCARKHFEMDEEVVCVHPCFKSELCNRDKAGITRLSPTEIPASLIMSYTCWGIVLSGGIYHTNYTLAAQLALSPYTSVFITTYTTIRLDPDAPACFLQNFESGNKIGDIILKFNQRHYALYKDFLSAMIIFGDPEYAQASSVVQKDLEDVLVSIKDILMPARYTVVPHHPHFFSTTYLDYSRAVGQLTSAIPKPAIIKATTVLQQATEKYWVAAKCFATRASTIPEQPCDMQPVENYARQALFNFHSAWCEFYIVILHNLGGYLRLQTDKVYVRADSKPVNLKRIDCPYCKGKLTVNRMHLVGEPQQIRLLHECPNCATVLDAAGDFLSADIQSNVSCSIKKPYEISLTFQHKPANLGKRLLTVIAVIEPFIKNGQGELAVTKTQTTLSSENQNHQIRLPNLVLPTNYVRGVHALNVLVLLEDEVALLRRTIYLVD